MNAAIKLALLICTAAGTAVAGSFEFHTLPPAVLEPTAALPATHAHLQATNLHAFAAARSFEGDGYIGTMHLDDTTFVSLPTGPTEVAVPEPATMILFGSGLALTAVRRHRTAHTRKAFPLTA